MEKEFVPYELAVKLKKLGFDEPCFAKWIERDERDGGGIVLEMWNDEDTNYEVKSSTKAPTFSQAFRWFREKHGLLHDITLTLDDDNQLVGFYIMVHELDGLLIDEDQSVDVDIISTERDEAELAGLIKMIEILEN